MTFTEEQTGVAASRTWRFRTAGVDPATTVGVDAGGQLFVLTQSPASVRVRLTRGGRTVELGPFGRGENTIPMPVEPGRYRLCIEQAAVGPYAGVDRCEDLQKSWPAPVRLNARQTRAGHVLVSAHAPKAASGISVRARVVGYRVGRRSVRVSRGAVLRGTLGSRSATWRLTGSVARRGVRSLTLRLTTGQRDGNAGQRWLRETVVSTVGVGDG